MNCQINKHGSLLIERRGYYRIQSCPFKHEQGLEACGDTCPHFKADDHSVQITCGSQFANCMPITLDERPIQH